MAVWNRNVTPTGSYLCAAALTTSENIINVSESYTPLASHRYRDGPGADTAWRDHPADWIGVVHYQMGDRNGYIAPTKPRRMVIGV